MRSLKFVIICMSPSINICICMYFLPIGKKKIAVFQFMCLLVEVRNVKNDRPLIYGDCDVNNLAVDSLNAFLEIGVSRDLSFSCLDVSG